MSRAAGLFSLKERATHEPVSAEDIVSGVSARLDRVEMLFRDSLASPVAIVDEIGDFVKTGGGKRVRPILHLLSADLCGYRGAHDVVLATVLEFIHSATLIHDDVIDAAETRRGRPSVHHRWGNTVTVLFGDYLYAKAMEMALSAGSLRVMERLAWITLRMTEGEMIQTRYAGRLDLTMPEYLDLIERKTAVLFGGCCELAGILSGVDEAAEDALRDYGLHIGLAFQIVDDILDFTGSTEVMGKPIASDLREGKATLPVLDLLASGSKRGYELAARIVSGEAGSEERDELTALLRSTGALDRAASRAREHAALAVSRLGGFSDGPAKRALAAVPDLLIARNR
ncbi:MAG TPA: polyprenyl synthetase family protein [Candidatus Polarisedimenticolaceae bacterium]|nr:polyprenyl synthetase family protein [Candidatus Polarisedimenticolaceae bacterium]